MIVFETIVSDEGVTGFDVAAMPGPTPLTAATENVYCVPSCRQFMNSALLDAGTTNGSIPHVGAGVATIEYEVINDPPSLPGGVQDNLA